VELLRIKTIKLKYKGEFMSETGTGTDGIKTVNMTDGMKEGGSVSPELLNVPAAPPKQTTLADLDIAENETMGLVAEPGAIRKMIELIALPLKSDQCEFGKIVLHFDSKRKEVWWSNKAVGGSFLVNFGHATYDFFANCWGDGEVALPAIKLLGYLDMLKEAREVTLSVSVKKRIYRIQDGKRDIFNGFIDALSEVTTHKPRIDYARNQSDNQIKLDDNYVPILKEEIAALRYGGVVEARELKRIVERGSKFGIRTYPIDFSTNPGKLVVSFNDITSPADTGTNTKTIVFKEGTMIAPDTPISQIISEKLKAPAKALKGEVILRLAKKDKAPVYLLKVDKNNGVMFAGMLIAAKEKPNQ